LVSLTALLTECLSKLRKGSSNSITESYAKEPHFLVDVRTSRLDLARQQRRQQRTNNSADSCSNSLST
jgi:hypothetical protein